MFEKTHQQAEIAFDCLKKAFEKQQAQPNLPEAENLVPYLIYASVLLFIRRDQKAFQAANQHVFFEQAGLPEKLRQLPAYPQLIALLNSQKDCPDNLIWQLNCFSDVALGVQHLRQFRDYFLINGLPGDGLPFAAPGFNYVELSKEALGAWQALTNA